ncbi:peptidyl-prolyl cis-trans isomerase-like 3 isoform X2 [Pipra filicauda]|uniref:Peptidyl-prolyl cis-trans isomerase-like 3 isoform X2 n=1 Tax=Pipra filicauda TaxID=649802 RepID=A0A7R5KS98_9PASS|nr:peptidyl-prolyl cis-trans isomerase-like 3 isoform X2 [Pipra filicauda]
MTISQLRVSPSPAGRHVLSALSLGAEKMASAALAGEAGALPRAPARPERGASGAGVRGPDPAQSPWPGAGAAPLRPPALRRRGGARRGRPEAWPGWGIAGELIGLTRIKEKDHFGEAAIMLRRKRPTVQKWTGEKVLQTCSF